MGYMVRHKCLQGLAKLEVPMNQGRKPREVAAEAATVAQALTDPRQPASATVAAAAATSDSPRGPKVPHADAKLALQPLALTRKRLLEGRGSQG